MVPAQYWVLVLFSIVTSLRNVEGAKPCRCGVTNARITRITGGQATAKNEFPWLAAVVRIGKKRPICSAVILNNRYVLTKELCIRTAFDKKVKHEILIHKHHTVDDKLQERMKIERIIKHPDSTVALAKLSAPMPFPDDNCIAPICLPPEGNDSYTGEQAIVAGWGYSMNGSNITRPEALMKLSVTVAPDADCKTPKSRLSASKLLCTTIVAGKGACFDAGSPLIVAGKDNTYSLIGILNGGSCGFRVYSDSYYRVTPLLSWIKKNTEDGKFCAKP